MQKTILILTANPSDTNPLNLEKEIEGIEQELTRPSHNQQFVVQQQWAATPDNVRQAMLEHQPYFVHFSGNDKTTKFVETVTAVDWILILVS